MGIQVEAPGKLRVFTCLWAQNNFADNMPICCLAVINKYNKSIKDLIVPDRDSIKITDNNSYHYENEVEKTWAMCNLGYA